MTRPAHPVGTKDRQAVLKLTWMQSAPDAPRVQLHDLPLGFLPAFEAAGRLGSFAAAASELHLTPSAISQQIRALEAALGVTLFERSGRSVVLTHDGREYLHEVRQMLQALSASTARLRRRSRGSVLRLSTAAVAAHEFLLPRLPDFSERFPGIQLRIETSNEYVDFKTTDYDAAIRIGTGWPDLRVHPFGKLTGAIVCAPELASQINDLRDLSRFTLLDPCGDGQRAYAALAGARGLPPLAAKVWTFETCHDTLRAAEHGLGFTFAVFPITSHWVRSGRLAIALPDRLPVPGSICLAYRPIDETRFPFREIAAWLEAQFAALPDVAELADAQSG